MKPFTFSLRGEPDQRLDCAALVPHRLAGLGPAEIARIALNTTKQKITAGDAFHIRAGDLAAIRFEGGSERLDNIGEGLAAGALDVEGPVGKAAGRKMSGGRLTISGDAGPFAGSGLSGGRIEITGSAGDFLGGPFPGEMQGMRGGLIVVRGRAGDRAGDRMRRGIIVIEKGSGDYVASRMIAGTLLVLGATGRLPGYLMRRGSLLLREKPSLSPAFLPCGTFAFGFARLFADSLKPESRAAARLLKGSFERYAGDMSVLGKGEVLVAAD
ncbi:MAG: formylmethanofuran dehydrogenase subunit [Methylobacteriaceae bacterium]|nr:formylmethanofuran dehydrogenase subunit [Methylobacteriaceae bacterium]